MREREREILRERERMDKDLLFLQPVICGLWQIVSMEKRGELDEESAVEAMNSYVSKRFRVRRV